MKDALGVCEENTFGLGNICKAGLMKFGSSIDLIKKRRCRKAAASKHAYIKTAFKSPGLYC